MEIKHFPLTQNIQAAYLTEAFRFTFFCVLQWALCGRKMSLVLCQITTGFEVFQKGVYHNKTLCFFLSLNYFK